MKTSVLGMVVLRGAVPLPLLSDNGLYATNSPFGLSVDNFDLLQ